MEDEKIKIDTRISRSDYDKAMKIAGEKYDGNKSLAFRMLIKIGLINSEEEFCEHEFRDVNPPGVMPSIKCMKCGLIKT